jgi:hypothetical protein
MHETIKHFTIKNYHPMPLRYSISRPITPQTETIPLDHAARANFKSFLDF